MASYLGVFHAFFRMAMYMLHAWRFILSSVGMTGYSKWLWLQVTFVLLASLISSQKAMACNWNLNFTSLSQTITSFDTTSCDSRPIEPTGEWGGLFDALGIDAQSYYGIGAHKVSGAPTPEDVSGTNNGVYTFTYNANAGQFNIQLKTAPTSGSDTLTFYSYVGPTGHSSALTNTLNTFTITYTPPAPVANAVSATVSANSSSNPITLAVTGTADAVAVGTQATHGVATASGTSITYTPTPGYSGTDSFTYTATNGGGTSSPATVTITVNKPTLALLPAAGVLPGATAGMSYSQTVTASLGTAAYSYAVTAGALPTWMTLNPTTGALSGMPTAAGTANFTVTATDGYGAVGSAAYSLTTVGTPQLSIDDVSQDEDNAGAFTFTVSLDQPAGAGGVTFDIATANDTATSPSDYVAKSLTGETIPAGATSLTFDVAVNGDTDFEADETFFVNVSNVTGASVTDSQGLGTIVNDDSAAVTSVSVPVNNTYAIGQDMDFIVHFDQNVTVTGTPRLTLSVGAVSRNADYVSGSGTNQVRFSNTVVEGDLDTNGIGIGTLQLNGGTIQASGIDANLTLNSVAATNNVRVDGVRPSVTSTSPAGGAGSADTSVTFTVNFSEAVSNVSDSDFTLSTAGTANGTIASVSASSGSAINVTVNAITGVGTIRLDAKSATGIVDAVGNAMSTGFSSGTTHTVNIPTSPAIAVTASDNNPAFGTSVTLTATLTGSLTPTGTVTFMDGAATLGTASVSGTTATFTTSALTVGAHSVTVVYGGDSNNAAATSPAITVTVGKSTPTVTASANNNTPALGVTVTLTATLADGISPTGTVTFKDGATTLGTGAIAGTTATYQTAALTLGAHSITAVYGGDTNNNAVTSAPVTVTVAPVAVTIAPASGALSAGTVGTPYSVQFTVTGSNGPYTFVLGGANPPGMTLDNTTGLFSGTPTAASNFNSRVVVNDASNVTVASFDYTWLVRASGFTTPTVSVSASSSNPALGAPVTLTATLTGGTSPTGTVTFKDGATTLGTGTISGTAATFSTSTLTAGAHSITAEYGGDVNNDAATSAALAITVGKTTPTITVSASNSKPALGAPVTLTATLASGTSPTGTVTFKDGTATLGTGTISGTTATFKTSALAVGTHSITAVYGGDAGNAAATSAAITVTVKKSSSFTFTPANGALKAAMAGEDYSQAISAKGGTGALTYRLKSGALPAGLILNISTGKLTGPLSTKAKVKKYSFVIEARDSTGATGTASYTLTVKARTVTVSNKTIEVPAGGTPTNVNLAAGATGGPFTAANLTFVQPPNAGTASIVRGEFAQASASAPLGWYLKFVPNPAFSGAAQVGFQLKSTLGVSNAGTVTYKLSHDAKKVADEIDDLVHGFVKTRQNLIASGITVPGLMERRQTEKATETVTARMAPSEDGMTARFSTSLAQMEAARDNADGITDAASSPFNVWIDGIFMAHKRDENAGKWGSFAMFNLGADYLVSERALVGLSVHFDRMSDPSDADAELTGNGWLAGPYASIELGKGVFWDTSLLYGGSANDIDTAFWDGSFDTKRWMLDTAIKGEIHLGEATVLTPKLRAVYFNEEVEDYSVKNSAGDEIDIEGFDEEQFRVSLGAEIARSFSMDDGSTVTPKLGVTAGYSGLDGSGAYASLTAGLTVETASLWMLDASVLLNIEGDGQKSVGARVGAAKQF